MSSIAWGIASVSRRLNREVVSPIRCAFSMFRIEEIITDFPDDPFSLLYLADTEPGKVVPSARWKKLSNRCFSLVMNSEKFFSRCFSMPGGWSSPIFIFSSSLFE